MEVSPDEKGVDMNGYSAGASLIFDRLGDGSVLIVRIQTDSNNREHVRFSHVISPDAWAGLIEFVSVDGGERCTRERIQMARDFHHGQYKGPIFDSDAWNDKKS